MNHYVLNKVEKNGSDGAGEKAERRGQKDGNEPGPREEQRQLPIIRQKLVTHSATTRGTNKTCIEMFSIPQCIDKQFLW